MEDCRTLRSVYIPADIDSRLKTKAFWSERTISEIIVDYVTRGLDEKPFEIAPEMLAVRKYSPMSFEGGDSECADRYLLHLKLEEAFNAMSKRDAEKRPKKFPEADIAVEVFASLTGLKLSAGAVAEMMKGNPK